ncbi:MAG: efflux RND transporter permease subunit [Synechococcus sp.]
MLLSVSTPFIKRPVLTTVCTIIIVLLGTISLALLPADKLPEIAPKRVTVTANYVGADAKTTVDNVTSVLEREINGVEDVKWIDSNTTNNGQATINISFPVEKDRNISQVLVQNRVAQAQTDLPQAVLSTGVKTDLQSPSTTLIYSFYSDKDENGEYLYDADFLFNYVDRYIWNELRRIKGVGSLTAGGAEKYSMRIWVDPDKLAARGLTAQDVVSAIQEQNFEVGAGGIGRPPSPSDQDFELPMRVSGRFTTPEEAENIVLRTGENGTLIRIRDIGRAEVGLENYFTIGTLDDGIPSTGLIIFQLPGTNALETADAVKAKMAELENSFPPGLNYIITLDNTLFVNASIDEAVMALVQAIVLVILIIFVFLQDWRTTMIPGIAIPVALIGAMVGLLVFDFSLNQLTLFACILASGLVCDDGITIVESVANKLDTGMRPMQAALDSMEELGGAVVSTSLVLMCVFIPVSFFPGTTGIVYRQFAITIAVAVAVSTFNALSFSPTMSALLLRPKQQVHGPLKVFFDWFNNFFDWFRGGYRRLIEFLTRMQFVVLTIFAAGMVLTAWMWSVVPGGFIPAEDQGYFFGITEAPPGASLEFTQSVHEQALSELVKFEEVEHVLALSGYSFDGQNSNKGGFFVKLKPWDERPGADKSVYGVIQRANKVFQEKVGGARIFAVNAPAVDGLGSYDGSEFYVQDRQLKGMAALIDNSKRVVQAANEREEIGLAFTTFTFDSPMLEADIDRDEAKAQNVAITDILGTLQTYLGSNYVNQYVLDGRVYRVFVQAEGNLRVNPGDIERLYVRSGDGNLVQLSNLVTATPIVYPPIVTNYNVYPAVKLIVSPAPGYSSGQVIKAMEELSDEVLQPGFGYEWTATALEEKEAGGAAIIVFGLAFVMVFLVLAAQYESYVDPFIIMITVPVSMLGALGLIWLRATFIQGSPLNPGAGIWPVLSNNLYVQVGLVMLIGLASKNAILIVEFANQARELGLGITQAAIRAADTRFRPILMTAISTMVGFLPLLIASGAGSVSRWSLGTAVFGGMLMSTALSLLFVPNLYIAIKVFERDFLQGGGKKPKPPKPPKSPKEADDREVQPTADEKVEALPGAMRMGDEPAT